MNNIETIRKNVLASELMRCTVALGVGRNHCSNIVKLIGLDKGIEESILYLIDNMVAKSCTHDECLAVAARNYSIGMFSYIPLLETRNLFDEFHNLIHNWCVAYESTKVDFNESYNALCKVAATHLLRTAFAIHNDDGHIFFKLRGSIAEALKFHYGPPVEIKRGDEIVNYELNPLTIEQVANDYIYGNIYDKVFKFESVPESTPEATETLDEEWSDIIG